ILFCNPGQVRRSRLSVRSGPSNPGCNSRRRTPKLRCSAHQQGAQQPGALLLKAEIKVVKAEIPSYDAEELSDMRPRELLSLMRQAGICTEGCLEQADLLDRIASSRLVTVTRGEEVPPPPAP
ncbi:unnamed protein product, partial [Ectocarpus sp. 6 AP-2014]